MIQITPEELAQYRTVFAADSIALSALDMLEDCDGDLEDAAINLALRSGQEPDRSDQWLDGLAKRWRVFLCSAESQQQFNEGTLAELVRSLGTETDIPAVLATPVVLYVLKTGVEPFCRPLEEKLS